MTDLDTIRGRAALGTVLLFIMAAATFLHFSISALSPVLTSEFDLSAVQLGVLGTMSNAVAALGAPFVGRAVDMTGGRRIAIILLIVTGSSTIGFGLAGSFGWLIAMTAVNGLAAAGSNPTTNHILSSHIPLGRQGLLLGVKQSGVRAGQSLAGALLPLGALAIGWGSTMMIAGAICLAGVAAVAMVVPPSQGTSKFKRASKERSSLGPTVWRLALFAILMGTAMSALLLYLPLYSFEKLGMTVQTAGLTVGVIGFVGLFARVAAGPLAERFSTPAIPLLMMAFGSALSAGLVWSAAPLVDNVVWLGVLGLGLTGAVWNTVGNLAIVSTIDAVRTGQASGVLHTAYLTGLAIGPILFGAVIEASGSYEYAWFGVSVLFVSATLVALRWWRVEKRGVGSGDDVR